jgi:hypothetical protein
LFGLRLEGFIDSGSNHRSFLHEATL